MDRRRFLAAVTGGIAALAGCASDEPTGPAGHGTETSPVASPERVYAGPTVTARAPEPSTDPPPTTAVVVTSTESVAFTPTMTATTVGDDGGSQAGGGSYAGGGGGSGASEPSEPTTSTPAESEPSSPLRLKLSTMTMQRVVGELTCTAGPLAWMELEIGFLRDGSPVESERLSRDGPGTGDTLAFDVESEETALDGVRLSTAYAYPDP